MLAVACTGVASPTGWASPVIVGDVLLASHRDEIHSYNLDDFTLNWTFPADADDIDTVALYGTPAVADGVVFVPTHDKTLYAIDIETGRQVWQPFVAGGELIGGALVSGGVVYFGSNDGNVYALDTETGREVWQPFATGAEVQSTPAISGGTLYVTSLDGSLYALDAATGDELWSFEADGGLPSSPVVDDAAGLIYIGGFDSRLRAIDVDTHDELWSVKAGNWFWTAPLVHNGVVYAGALDGKVYAIKRETGDPVWREPFETDSFIRAAPVVAGGKLIVADRGGHVYGIDPDTGLDASNGALALSDDVFTDPLTILGSGGTENVLIVTRGGDLEQIDPEALITVGRPISLGE